MFDNIAIIAGSGKLPFKVASHLKKLDTKFIILSIKGFSKLDPCNFLTSHTKTPSIFMKNKKDKK